MMLEYSSFSMRTTTTLEKCGMPGFGGGGMGGMGGLVGVGDRAGGVVERSGTGSGVTVLFGVARSGVASVPAGTVTPAPEDL
jgi:hypothetical protein